MPCGAPHERIHHLRFGSLYWFQQMLENAWAAKSFYKVKGRSRPVQFSAAHGTKKNPRREPPLNRDPLKTLYEKVCWVAICTAEVSKRDQLGTVLLIIALRRATLFLRILPAWNWQKTLEAKHQSHFCARQLPRCKTHKKDPLLWSFILFALDKSAFRHVRTQPDASSECHCCWSRPQL